MRCALVTGGALGIGAGIARALVHNGYMVTIADINSEAGGALARELGGTARFAECDVRDDHALASAVQQSASDGRLDLLVNNVGINREGSIESFPVAHWDALVDVNLKSYWRAAQLACGALTAAQGSIINISSVQAVACEPNVAAYAAQKAGALGMTRGLAVELAARGVRVNAILPGAMNTPMQTEWLAAQADGDATLAAMQARIPLGRLGTPADVGALVLFLASPEAAYITGASFVVDGGLTARLAL